MNTSEEATKNVQFQEKSSQPPASGLKPTIEQAFKQPEKSQSKILDELEFLETRTKTKRKEERRMKGIIRSKRSRETKKQYIVSLEAKVKELEEENFRLQNILINYRSDKLNDIDRKAKKLIDKIQSVKHETIERYYDPKTKKCKDDFPHDLSKNFSLCMYKNLETHKEFLDRTFECLINSYNCNWKPEFIGDLTASYTTPYKIIQKYAKLLKSPCEEKSMYQKSELIKTHKLTKADEFMASMDPTPLQYTYGLSLFKKYYDLKCKYSCAIEHLCKAKELLERTNLENSSFIKFILSSNIFDVQQLLNSMLKKSVYMKDNAFRNLWKVSVTPVKVTTNIHNDSIIGDIAKKLLKGSQEISFEFNKFSL
ncbi:unnamed protein product [Moneuplotes crassus]|uniref:BZIP domain-containing protein n=1 Tax=Euplotes crassus TaxID=5936 RepID=A0AAD2CWP8_EUPCR|nr:unnamed protein product [Moneuplotes crassus]